MIALGCDHAGFDLMQEVISYLQDNNIEFKNFGTYDKQSCDYPVFAGRVARSVLSGECERGVRICGTGIGITIAANRYKGIRAANCANVFMAKACREHNDANILGMGGRVIGTGTAIEILKAFLETEFSQGERHIRRINEMDDMENIEK